LFLFFWLSECLDASDFPDFGDWSWICFFESVVEGSDPRRIFNCWSWADLFQNMLDFWEFLKATFEPWGDFRLRRNRSRLYFIVYVLSVYVCTSIYDILNTRTKTEKTQNKGDDILLMLWAYNLAIIYLWLTLGFDSYNPPLWMLWPLY
jgi:hypothetical protein